MADDTIPVIAIDHVDARAAGHGKRLGVSEISYSQLTAAAVAHATRPEVAADPTWAPIGPRNVGGRITAFAQDSSNPQVIYAGSAHGGLWVSRDAGDTWAHVGQPKDHPPIGTIAIKPGDVNTVIVGTGSMTARYGAGTGLFRVEMAPNPTAAIFVKLAGAPGLGSSPGDDGLAAKALRYTRIRFDPDNPERFWVASQTGLWRFEPRVDPGFKRDFPVGTNDPTGAPALATSLPFDATWPDYCTDLLVARDPRKDKKETENGREVPRFLVLYVGVSGAGVFRGRFDRKDATIEWDSVLTVPNDDLYAGGRAFSRVRLALCEERPSTVYAVFASNPGFNPASAPPQNFPEHSHASFVFRSEDNGDEWTRRGRIPRAAGYQDGATTTDGQADYCMLIEVAPSNADILVCGEIDVCHSTDGGLNWTTILDWQNYDQGDYSQHADQHIALFDRGDHRKLWVGNDGGLSLARDLQLHPQTERYWRKRSHGILAAQFQDVTVHPLPAFNFMCGGGLQDNGSFAGVGGATWMHLGFADGGSLAFHAAVPEHIFIGQNSFVNVSTIQATPFISPATQGLVNPILADLPLTDPRQFVRINGMAIGTAGTGPFVGLLEQDPTLAGRCLVGWTASATDSIAYIVNPPAAPPLPDPLLAAVGVGVPLGGLTTAGGVVAALEDAEALAFGPIIAGPPQRIEGWIGTSFGKVLFSLNASSPAGWALAPAVLPLIGGVGRLVTRISVHPSDSWVVAVASVPDVDPNQFPATAVAALSSNIVITITTGGAVGAARFTFKIGTGAVSAPLLTAPSVDVPGTLSTLFFTPGAFVVGNSWTVAPDGTVTAAGGNTSAGGVAATPNTGGRVFLTYDRGATWTDVSAPAALPRPNPDLAALSPGPAGALEWDRTTASPTRLFAGTLGGVYVLPNIPSPTGLTLAAKPANIPLGTTIQLQANLAMNSGPPPIDCTSAADWSSSNPLVLTVNTTGLVTIVGGAVVGQSSTITVRRGVFFDTVAMTVQGAPPPPAPPAPGAPAAFVAPTVPVAWRPFGKELPIVLVNDLTFVSGTSLLRAATFGRGIWDVNLGGDTRHRLYIRQTVIEDGRTLPRVVPTVGPAPGVPLMDPRLPQTGATRFAIDFVHAYDIRVDAAPHSFFDDVVDGVEFDEQIGVDNAVPFEDNYVYVQVSTSGIQPTDTVNVFLFARLSPVPAPHTAAPVAIPALGNVSDIYPPADAAKPVAPWVRIGDAPTTIKNVGPGQPVVARFTWSPDDTFADQDVALVAMCTSPNDALPDPIVHGASFDDFILNEPKAALRIVHVALRPPARIYIRDGVADDTRLGGYPVGGRSPDIMVVRPDITDPPADVFKDHIARRSTDTLSGTDPNFIYVRVHNRRRFETRAQVKVFAIDLDDSNAPDREPGFWTELPAGAAFADVTVPPSGVGYARVEFPAAADPNFLFVNKTYLLLALIKSEDDRDPLPNRDRVDSGDSFWELVSRYVDSDNAAARAVPWVP